MYHRVLAEPEQFLTEVDLARLGAHPQDGADALLRTLFGSGRYYKGFEAVAVGLTKISVAPGLLYDDGRMHAALAADERTINEFIPFEAGKKVVVTLVAQRREQPGFPESRTYEREIAVSGGGTTTQLVPAIKPRVQIRDVVLTLNPGAQSTAPSPPSPLIGTVAIADIVIGTGGIESVTRRTEAAAPQLIELAIAVRALAAKNEQQDQEIAGLRTALAALARELANAAKRDTLLALTGDVSRIKDRLDMPDTGTPYGADRFLTEAESDTAHVDYKARVEEGMRFPYANFWRGPLAFGAGMANSPNLLHQAQGYICPKYTAVDGLTIAPRAGAMPLGGTVYQTMELKQLTMSREVVRYGDYFEVCENKSFWQSGRYDPVQGVFTIGTATYEVGGYTDVSHGVGHRFIRLRKFWSDKIQEPYGAYVPVPHTITGVIKSQTWVQAQGRYTPGIRLAIESWSPGASVTANLVECGGDGKPDPDRLLATVTIAATQFKKYDGTPGTLTRFPFAIPAWLKPGVWGVMYATQGDVTVAYAEGQEHLAGNLFDMTGADFQQGDLTRDLCMVVEYCRFDVIRLAVQLAGFNLDGGIHDLGIKAAMIVPTNTSARWALLAGGVWQPLPRPNAEGVLSQAQVPDNLFGAGNTPFYDARVELVGNRWEMPLIDMNVSEVSLFRADDHMRHISVARLFGANAVQVVVRAVVAPWDGGRHTLACRLRHGANYASLKVHDAVQVKTVVNRPAAREMIWTFNFTAPGIDRCKLDFVGTTNNARVTFHVEYSVYNA